MFILKFNLDKIYLSIFFWKYKRFLQNDYFPMGLNYWNKWKYTVKMTLFFYFLPAKISNACLILLLSVWVKKNEFVNLSISVIFYPRRLSVCLPRSRRSPPHRSPALLHCDVNITKAPGLWITSTPDLTLTGHQLSDLSLLKSRFAAAFGAVVPPCCRCLLGWGERAHSVYLVTGHSFSGDFLTSPSALLFRSAWNRIAFDA